MRAALLALAVLSTACSHTAQSGAPEPRAKTTVKVQNQNFLDMDVFVWDGGQRIRLGMVAGLSTQVFTLPDYVLRGSQQLQFELHPIGGRANPRSETISVRPGDEVELIVPPL
jgi:hypothetical protein